MSSFMGYLKGKSALIILDKIEDQEKYDIALDKLSV